MNDQELIELVQQKPPEDLTVEEIDQLRVGIGSSPDLAEAIAEHIRMEEDLNESLGKVKVSVEKIVLAAAAGAALGGGATSLTAGSVAGAGISPIAGWAIGTVITAVLSSVLVLAVVVPPPKPEVVDPLKEPVKKLEIDDIPAPSVGEPVGDPKDRKNGEKTDPKGADRSKKKGGDPNDSAELKLAKADIKPEPVIDPETLAAEEWEKAGLEAQPPFAVAAFQDFAPNFGTQFAQGSGGNRPELELAKIFAPIPAMGGKLSVQQADGKSFWAVVEGWQKFQPKWRKDAVLRFGFLNEERIQLHFYNGNQGVAFVYYPNYHGGYWAAYGTTRKPGEVKPSSYAFWDLDDERYKRTGYGTVEVRQQDGLLVLTRGDVVLLAVPFAKPPSEIYLTGKALVRGMQLLRGVPIPPETLAAATGVERPVIFRSSEPAQLDWKRKLAKGADVQSREGGRITLTGQKSNEPSYLWLPMPEVGLCEVIFQVDAEPGTAVYLGDDKGNPKQILGFFQDKKLQQRVVGTMWPGDRRVDSESDIFNRPTPVVTDGGWLKLLVGYGVFKVYASGDGVHWGRALDPIKGEHETACKSLGLVAQPGDTPRKITLRTVEVRRLGALAALAGDVDDAPSLPVFNNPLDWLREVVARQPNGVSPQLWQRACAVRTLQGGPPPALAKAVLKGLVELAIDDPSIPVATRVAALQEAADLSDTFDEPDALKVVAWFEKLGQALADQGDPRPYQQISQGLLESPIATWGQISILPPDLIRYEALGHVYSARWEDVRALCRRVNFLIHPRMYQGPRGKEETRKLIQWVNAWETLQHVGARAWLKERESGVIAASWRHPLEEQISKEAYNILAEFEAALAGGSFTDACQIITSAGAYGALGLLPDGKEPQLLVSLPSAVALAMRESAGLKRTMKEQFGRVGLLRVRQAMQDGNAVEVQAATVQFYGTEAADEAHLWLGDRSLAGGDFAHAVGHYRQLSPEAMNIKGPQVAARIRLAAALSGREAGQPVTSAVEFGGTKLSPEEFEALVSDLRTRRFAGGQLGLDSSGSASLANAPPPARYTAAAFARYTPNSGANGPNPTSRMGDWLGTQTAGVVAGDQWIASNRFELVAYDVNNGNQRWSRNIGGNAGKTHEAPGAAMWPLVVKDRIFTRWLGKNGPELVCLDLASGKQLWNAKNAGAVLSDPIVIEDQVHVFCGAGYENRMLQVSYVIYDARNGQIATQRPLTQFRDVWNKQIPCQAVRAHDRIVATLGGVVVSVNLLGHAQWMRRQTAVPMTQDEAYLEQVQSPPLVHENSVYATQPGVRDVECLDLETGRLKWLRPLPEITRLIGIADGRLLVATRDGLVGLDLAKGEQVWRRNISGLQWAMGLGAPARMNAKPDDPKFNGLVYAVSEQQDLENTQVSLVWLDPATGREVARHTVWDLPATKTPFVGPLVTSGDRTWLFFRRNLKEGSQEIFELKSDGQTPEATKPPAALVSLDAHLPPTWVRDLLPYSRESISATLPGWVQLEGIGDKQTGLRKDWQGKTDVFCTLGTNTRPVCFTRGVTLPPGSKARLVLEVGREQNDKFTVEVRVGNKVLSAEKLESGVENGWKKWEVDLSKYAGQTVWLWVEQRGLEAARTPAYWKRLDIVE